MMKTERNFYFISDQYGEEKVMAMTIEKAIAAFYAYRAEEGKKEPRITLIQAQLSSPIIITE